MIDYSAIQKVHLEISTRCNASCPLCPRNLSGYDDEFGYPLHSMSLQEAKKIFTPAFLRQLKVILINGNFGDFLTAPDALSIVQYFATANPRILIRISTNGGANPKLWPELGKIPNTLIGFALDGLKDTHSLYRRNTSWDVVVSNASNYISAGGRAIWRMVKFDHNFHQIEDCKRLSREMGFFDFELIFDGRDSGPVYDRKGNFLFKLGSDPAFKQIEYPKRIEIWREWSAVKSEERRLEEYKSIEPKSAVSCAAKKHQEIYVTATGEVYPCCWLGMYPKLEIKHSWQEDNHQVKKLVKSNNALDVGIENSVKWFNEIEESWNKKTYPEGRLIKCDTYCGQ